MPKATGISVAVGLGSLALQIGLPMIGFSNHTVGVVLMWVSAASFLLALILLKPWTWFTRRPPDSGSPATVVPPGPSGPRKGVVARNRSNISIRRGSIENQDTAVEADDSKVDLDETPIK